MTGPYVGGAFDLSSLKNTAGHSAEDSVQVMAVSMANVEEELIKRSAQVPVVVLIGTSRSPQSEQLQADLSALAQAAGGRWVLRTVDADTDPQVAHMFGIQGLPTVVALASGQPIASFEGGQPQQALRQWVDAVVAAVGNQLPGLAAEPEEAEDPRFAPATAALGEGDFATAIAVYESILAQEPGNQMAVAALGNARFLQRLSEQDPSVDPIAAASAHPDDVTAQLAAADAEVAAGQPEAAFDRLIAVIAGVAGQARDIVRARLFELFAMYDSDDPRVLGARTKLATALF